MSFFSQILLLLSGFSFPLSSDFGLISHYYYYEFFYFKSHMIDLMLLQFSQFSAELCCVFHVSDPRCVWVSVSIRNSRLHVQTWSGVWGLNLQTAHSCEHHTRIRFLTFLESFWKSSPSFLSLPLLQISLLPSFLLLDLFQGLHLCFSCRNQDPVLDLGLDCLWHKLVFIQTEAVSISFSVNFF